MRTNTPEEAAQLAESRRISAEIRRTRYAGVPKELIGLRPSGAHTTEEEKAEEGHSE